MTSAQPPPILLREAAPADIPAMLALYNSAGITAEFEFSVPEAIDHLDSLSRYPFYRVFVATMQEEVVGTYEFLLMDNLAKRGAKSAIVEDVAIAPSVQRRGIGKLMMNHARALARRHGAYKLVLSSNNKRTEAHAFYRSLGFEAHGVSFLVEP